MFENIWLLLLVCLFYSSWAEFISYENVRNSIMNAEEGIALGGRIMLNEKEETVNRILMETKKLELGQGLRNEKKNAAGMHFFKAKHLIDQSKVFEFIKRMPKGATLHAHNTAQVSSEWIIQNVTYNPKLYMCTNSDNVLVFTFRKHSSHNCRTSYRRVVDERKKSRDIKLFDKKLETNINLYTPTPEVKYPSTNEVWRKFQNMFTTVSDMIRFLPIFRAYHIRLLEELYEDGIMYIEMRMSFQKLYDLFGNIYSPLAIAKDLKRIVEEFKIKNAGFLGLKTIFSTHRNTDKSTVLKELDTFLKLHAAFPEFVVGFDLVGQEDIGKPLLFFADIFSVAHKSAKFFFHAGETNWYGQSTDLNLLDALLLNTTRIGHGYALIKHPILWNTVKKRDIAVEVSPISNQILGLVSDLRNHPGSFFLSQDVPMVICNDDPGFWNSKGVSYDFYYAFMSFSSYTSGLKTLKQLVWNSIKYSVLSRTEKQIAYTIVQKQWNRFIDYVMNTPLIH
ncbi:CECR1.2 family protein [Megaselia abdita]